MAKAAKAAVGHNNPPEDDDIAIETAKLKAEIDKIERLAEEKATIGEDISEIFKGLKSMGYDTRAIRQVLALRKLGAEEAKRRETVRDLYKEAIGL